MPPTPPYAVFIRRKVFEHLLVILASYPHCLTERSIIHNAGYKAQPVRIVQIVLLGRQYVILFCYRLTYQLTVILDIVPDFITREIARYLPVPSWRILLISGQLLICRPRHIHFAYLLSCGRLERQLEHLVNLFQCPSYRRYCKVPLPS